MCNVDGWAEQVAEAVAAVVADRICQPTATYRLQFAEGAMGFRDAAAVVPFLAELGISHLYASPYLKARAGSKHGYDVVDYSQLNPELGSPDDYRAMVDALHRHAMGQILDTVPNHMSTAAAENPWWEDVLENGPGSPKAACFDIDWRPVKEELRNKVLLPVLAEQYGQVLEAGDLKVEFGGGAFRLRYYQTVLPLEPRTYRMVLARKLDELKQSLPADADDLRELESILTAIEHLPAYTQTEPSAVAERRREKEVIKDRLASLARRSPPVAEHIRRNVEEINGMPGDPASFDQLDELLGAQVYRPLALEGGRRRNQLSPLLRHQRVGRRLHGRSGRLRRQPSTGVRVAWAGATSTGCGSITSTACYDPVEYLRRLQAGYLRHLGKAAYQRLIETVGQASLPAAERL